MGKHPHFGRRRPWPLPPPMGCPHLFRSMVRVDTVMGDAAYDRQHPNRAGGRAHTVQSTVDFCAAWLSQQSVPNLFFALSPARGGARTPNPPCPLGERRPAGGRLPHPPRGSDRQGVLSPPWCSMHGWRWTNRSLCGAALGRDIAISFDMNNDVLLQKRCVCVVCVLASSNG